MASRIKQQPFAPWIALWYDLRSGPLTIAIFYVGVLHMQIITGELEDNIQQYPLTRFGGRANILPVDIETTGLVSH